MTCSCVVSHLFIHHNSFFFYLTPNRLGNGNSMCVFIFHMLISAVCFFFKTLFFFKSSIKSRRDRYRKNIKTHQKNITFYTLFFFRQKMKRDFFLYCKQERDLWFFVFREMDAVYRCMNGYCHCVYNLYTKWKKKLE